MNKEVFVCMADGYLYYLHKNKPVAVEFEFKYIQIFN